MSTVRADASILSFDEPPIDVPCRLVQDQAGGRACWWCTDCRNWHSHGWKQGDDGRRLRPCLGQIRLVPSGWADAALLECIRQDHAPPGFADPDVLLTPDLIRSEALRGLTSILSETEASNGELDTTITNLEGLLLALNTSRFLHRKTLGAARANDIPRVCKLVAGGKTVEQAMHEVLPYLPVEYAYLQAEDLSVPGQPQSPGQLALTGIIVTPELARNRARRELAKMIDDLESEFPFDEFCDVLSDNLESEVRVLKIWSALHGKLQEKMDKAYIWAVLNAVLRHQYSIESAALLLLSTIGAR